MPGSSSLVSLRRRVVWPGLACDPSEEGCRLGWLDPVSRVLPPVELAEEDRCGRSFWPAGERLPAVWAGDGWDARVAWAEEPVSSLLFPDAEELVPADVSSPSPGLVTFSLPWVS